MSLNLLDEVQAIKIKQDLIINNLNSLIDQNKKLWKQLYLHK